MKNERGFLLLLALLQFTNIMDFMIMMPLGPQLMKVFAINPEQFSAAVSAYSIAAGISGMVSAFWLDKLDRKTALLIMYAGFIVGTLCCALSPTYTLLYCSRMVTGVFGGILGAIVMSIVADVIPESRRGAAMGIVSTSFSMASVLGVPFGLFLATQYESWHAPFLFIVGVGIIIWVILFKVLPPMKSHFEHHDTNSNVIHNFVSVISAPTVQLALLFMVLLMFGQFGIVPFISPYMVANVGISQKELPLIYFFGGAATIFTAPLVGKISDKIGKPKVFFFFGILALIPAYFITNLGAVGLVYALVLTTSFFIVTNGRFVPAMALTSNIVPPQKRGTFMSINSSLMQLASGAASLLAGKIVVEAKDGSLQNYHYVGYISIAASIFALFMLPVLLSTQKKEVAG